MVMAIFAVMAYGLDIVVTDLGEVSLAHPVFFAAGAYATGLLATRAGFGAWGTLAGAVLAAAAIAAVLGLLTLRLREFVFSLVTYAASVVAAAVAHNWDFLGGSDGIVGDRRSTPLCPAAGAGGPERRRSVALRLRALASGAVLRGPVPALAPRRLRGDGAPQPAARHHVRDRHRKGAAGWYSCCRRR